MLADLGTKPFDSRARLCFEVKGTRSGPRLTWRRLRQGTAASGPQAESFMMGPISPELEVLRRLTDGALSRGRRPKCRNVSARRTELHDLLRRHHHRKDERDPQCQQ